MGLFSLFAGKSPEELEMIADGYAAASEFGAAKVEYDKALEKAEKKYPEKQALIRRLTEKSQSARESLAHAHINAAVELIQAESFDDAEALLHLAYELTGDANVRAEVKSKIDELMSVPNAAIPSDAPPESVSVPSAADPTDAGEEYFQVLLSALPEDIQAAYQAYGDAFRKGYTALNRGDFKTAGQYLEAAAAENPSPDNWIPIELATAYMNLSQPEKARETAFAFIRNNPESLRGYQLLCEIYWETGDYQAAAELLNNSPKTVNSSGSILMLLGETYYQAGRYEAARDVFLDGGRHFGNEEMINRALAKTYEAMGDFDKALGLYGDILNRCASCRARVDPFIKRRFAQLSFQAGDTSTPVLEMFLSLVREDPDHRKEYYEQIAKIYEATGHHKEARRYYGFSK